MATDKGGEFTLLNGYSKDGACKIPLYQYAISTAIIG